MGKRIRTSLRLFHLYISLYLLLCTLFHLLGICIRNLSKRILAILLYFPV